MLFDITKFIKKPINGIIQVGAHYGSEYESLKLISKNILMFEPQSSVFKILQENMKKNSNVKIEKLAIGSKKEKKLMYLEENNSGQSSSLLMPQLHIVQYPSIKFVNVEEVDVITLNEYFLTNTFNYNLITLDVQGFELEVLQGATEILNKIDYILCEVNRAELYKNCPMVDDIDLFLSNYGFKREHTSWDGYTWGDAFYAKY